MSDDTNIIRPPLVVRPDRRDPHAPQTFGVVSLSVLKEQEWRKDWYAPAIATGLTQKDAEFLVRAVNSHADLFGACMRFVAGDTSEAALDAGVAAIAKARGTP